MGRHRAPTGVSGLWGILNGRGDTPEPDQEKIAVRRQPYRCEQCTYGTAVLMDNTTLRYWCLVCAQRAVKSADRVEDFSPLQVEAAHYLHYLAHWREAGDTETRPVLVGGAVSVPPMPTLPPPGPAV